jgi:hypothetical protein
LSWRHVCKWSFVGAEASASFAERIVSDAFPTNANHPSRQAKPWMECGA